MALTLRLTDDELQTLDRIKHLEDEKTAAGTIKKLIAKYEQIILESKKTKLENHRLATELLKLQGAAKDYVQAQHNLTDMVYGDEWNDELIRRARAIDAGESKGYTLEEFKEKTRHYLNEIKN